ncbi:hypothetical protein PQQ75_25005 [Paraburkholderia aspalathi]|uniref:hypothetical protein n=1 Tax=Paraburkholderia aspalathi TaxID=1324617 RepID=UPI0038B80DDC
MNEGQLPLDPQWLLHRPITGPRNGHIGEQVFCEKWIDLQQREAEFREVDEPAHTIKLARILRHAQLPEIGERECTVAASWACYLGCNVGASVIHLGDSLKAGVGEYRRFLAAWAIHNTRAAGVNRGFRAIEFVLAPADHVSRDPFAFSRLERAPDLCITDYEVIEHLWLWLGTDEGAAWLTDCQREIDRRQAAAWRALHETINAAIVCGTADMVQK